MAYLRIAMVVLVIGGLFIGVRSIIKKEQDEKQKKAKKLVFEIGPITLK